MVSSGRSPTSPTLALKEQLRASSKSMSNRSKVEKRMVKLPDIGIGRGGVWYWVGEYLGGKGGVTWEEEEISTTG